MEFIKNDTVIQIYIYIYIQLAENINILEGSTYLHLLFYYFYQKRGSTTTGRHHQALNLYQTGATRVKSLDHYVKATCTQGPNRQHHPRRNKNFEI